METRSTLQIVRDAIAIVRDVLLILAMFTVAYLAVSAGVRIHQLEQQIGIATPPAAVSTVDAPR